MKLLLAITACWLLAGSAVAQRGGMGGGFRGGMGGGTRGGMGGGFRGGVGLGGRGMIGGGFRPGNRFFFRSAILQPRLLRLWRQHDLSQLRPRALLLARLR